MGSGGQEGKEKQEEGEEAMSCCHPKREIVTRGTWKCRDKKSLVKENIIIVYHCRSCGAIRLDSKNKFCYSRGTWSGPNLCKNIEPIRIVE
jgi:hypothetical protein